MAPLLSSKLRLVVIAVGHNVVLPLMTTPPAASPRLLSAVHFSVPPLRIVPPV